VKFLQLKQELEEIVGDRHSNKFASWLNNAVLELTADFEFPALRLREPLLFVTKQTKWLYDLPNVNRTTWATSTAYALGADVVQGSAVYNCILAHTSGASTQPGTGASWATYWELITTGTGIYQKKLFKVLTNNWDGEDVSIFRSFRPIEEQDYDHDDTGDYVESIGVEDKQIATYPMSDDVLQMWFYRRPVDMSADSDLPDGIPEDYHRRVILPKVGLQNFEIIQTMALNAPQATLKYWHDKYEEGLYGTPRGDVGMIRYLAKFKGGPKVRGGRDPIP
jgi:hypothetical protein